MLSAAMNNAAADITIRSFTSALSRHPQVASELFFLFCWELHRNFKPNVVCMLLNVLIDMIGRSSV
jgi:hypothetical protein